MNTVLQQLERQADRRRIDIMCGIFTGAFSVLVMSAALQMLFPKQPAVPETLPAEAEPVHICCREPDTLPSALLVQAAERARREEAAAELSYAVMTDAERIAGIVYEPY